MEDMSDCSPEWLIAAYENDRKYKDERIKLDPSLANDGDFLDAHNCSAFCVDGCCDYCGALVYGTSQYYSEHSCDPPEREQDEYNALREV